MRTAITQPALFMKDNAPCHTAKSFMEWPAESPDISSIENVWNLLNERPKEENPRNVEEQ